MTPSDPSNRLFAGGLVQPDRRTCGSASLVAARLINRPEFAQQLLAGPVPQASFQAEALAVHRRTSGLLDARGLPQLPWPRALGTAPWSLVRYLDAVAGVPGTRYDARLVLPHQRARAFDWVRAAVLAGQATPVYVGNRRTPRHVVLAVASESPDSIRIYDPSQGRRYPIERRDWSAARLDVAGWRVPWLVVVPRHGTGQTRDEAR
ncbi:conserved hypothetical protein [metagenome]|uniref:Peptidase C39-like domain-containing protein n=1 Tax=metagenome TaxID=256318 RepID=A0A2P2C8N7_9ZZZZ